MTLCTASHTALAVLSTSLPLQQYSSVSLQRRPNGVMVVLAEDLQPATVARHNGLAAIAACAHVRAVELQPIEAHHSVDDQVLLLWQKPAHTVSNQSSPHTSSGKRAEICGTKVL